MRQLLFHLHALKTVMKTLIAEDSQTQNKQNSWKMSLNHFKIGWFYWGSIHVYTNTIWLLIPIEILISIVRRLHYDVE